MRLALPATLAGVSVLLLCAIGYEAFAPLAPAVVDVPSAPPSIAPRATPQLFIPPPESDFADIDARPLFSSARKPLADAVQTSAALSVSSDFSLAGVIMDEDHAVALIRIKSTTTTTNAALGDAINGWRVVKIEARQVTLRANGSDAVIGLEGPAARAPTAALAPAAPPSPPPPPLPVAPPPATAPAAAAAPAATPSPVPPGPAKPAATANTTPPPKPNGHPAIVPDALKGATFDPQTGEPTL
ncbi:MAG: hypothetical protein ISS15_15615 [Alphaproteobacteria bacterium]|nr:hypothetical protein [Alphaproteobacteria bacterium]MBL7099087.1 hypothetical protein [Alphaproteobacteria bacterium]